MIRVLLADDHPLVRTGLRSALANEDGVRLFGESDDGNETQQLARVLRPNVLLLDVSMPGPTATETIKVVQRDVPRTQILILTAYKDPGLVRGLLSAGVAGYLLKDDPNAAIVEAVRVVGSGGSWISPSVLAQLAQLRQSSAAGLPRPDLSELEAAVLRLLIVGKGDLEIAAALDMSERTVRRHLRSLYDKLGAVSRVQAAVHSIQMGLVALPPLG